MSGRFNYNPRAPRIGPGVYCLEDLRQRCAIDKETGCWKWGLSLKCAGNGSVIPHLAIPAGVFRPTRVSGMSARKAAWLMSGRRLPEGYVVWRTCCNGLCVNPAHCKAGTKAQEGGAIAASGRLKGCPIRTARNLRTVARTQAVPIEVVRQIEADLRSGAMQRDIAAQHGVCIETVSAINCGRHLHQRAGLPGSSAFAGVSP